MSLIDSYNKLAQKYSHEKSIKALKKHYSDICSTGDVIINKLINILNEHANDNNANNYILNYKNTHNNINYFNSVYESLIETIDEFHKNGLKPNPFWAN
jgi:hypothetical protein